MSSRFHCIKLASIQPPSSYTAAHVDLPESEASFTILSPFLFHRDSSFVCFCDIAVGYLLLMGAVACLVM